MIEHEAKVLDINEQDMCEKLEGIGANKILDTVTYIEGFDFEGGLTERMTSSGTTTPERFMEIADRIYDLGSGNTMFEQGAYLRLREEGEKTELIFKQRLKGTANVKSEIEISVPIGRGEWSDTTTWLEGLGLEKIAIQQKKRVSYVYDPYRYDIDTWPGIPTYMEVEAPSQEAVMVAVALVGIAHNRALSLTAAEVFKMYGVENPLRLLFNEAKS